MTRVGPRTRLLGVVPDRLYQTVVFDIDNVWARSVEIFQLKSKLRVKMYGTPIAEQKLIIGIN